MTNEMRNDRQTIGVVGAGTMGAGIAQLAITQGFNVVLFDIAEGHAERARAQIEARLERATRDGRAPMQQAAATLARLRVLTRFDDLGAAELVIEAAPEELELKQQLFARLGALCAPETLLASNTSALPITSIAATARLPERVVGMHFFNPAPKMSLVEIVAGASSSDTALATAEDFARRLGKTPLRVRDTPGFIVNRIARPYYGEALRIVAEGTATTTDVDRIMRAHGFALGPFELLDLIGLEVNLAVTRTIYEATYHEPRFRPHPLQVSMVEAGRLGRKSGQGFYNYTAGEPSRAIDSAPVRQAATPGLPASVLVAGHGPVADDLALALAAAGQNVTVYAGEVSPAIERAGIPRAQRLRDALLPLAVAIEATVGPRELKRAYWYELDDALPDQVPILTCGLAHGTTEVASWSARPDRVVGFGYIGAFAATRVVELGRGLRSGAAAVTRAQAFFNELGKDVMVVGDPPGQVASRILAMLSNEACFVLGEGIAKGADIDAAMQLGLKFPRGPLAWADLAGLATIVETLDGLHAYYGDERYRVAPVLRRAMHAGRALLAPHGE